jgi:lactoylglutathione lyase
MSKLFLQQHGEGGFTVKIKFDMIGIFVQDLQKMVLFYKDVVGIDIDWNGVGSYAEFKHEGIRFAMYERKQLPVLLGKEPTFPSSINGTFELAINVGAPEQVDVFYKKITDSGAIPVYAPRDEPWKMRSAMVTDPEGNLIEIASDFWK